MSKNKNDNLENSAENKESELENAMQEVGQAEEEAAQIEESAREEVAKISEEEIAQAEEEAAKAAEYARKQAAKAEAEAAARAAAKAEKAEQKRTVYREKRLKKHNAATAKAFAQIDAAEQREKSKTDDPTLKREIELIAEKKRKDLKESSEQQARVIASSTGARLSYEKKKGLYGYAFISIWIIGAILVFIGPLITSVVYSLNETTLVDSDRAAEYGMDNAGIHLKWNKFENFEKAFQAGYYVTSLLESLSSLVPDVIIILIFSLFVAMLLNQKFKGRTFMRAVFFLPVLIATGPVISIINDTMNSQGALGDGAQSMFQVDMVDGFMEFMGLYYISESATTFIETAASGIFDLLWRSGIQILIFLSALQQVPTSAKEAASMEGATAWEFFWKITFPTISPMILANLIYTIIDTFSSADNAVMKQVMTRVNTSMNEFGVASAMAWVYFGIIAIALAIVVGIVSRFVFYQVD